MGGCLHIIYYVNCGRVDIKWGKGRRIRGGERGGAIPGCGRNDGEFSVCVCVAVEGSFLRWRMRTTVHRTRFLLFIYANGFTGKSSSALTGGQ